MADDEQRKTEKIEAARPRAEYAAKVHPAQLHRLRTRVDPADSEQRSLYNTGMSTSTTPTGMLDRWPRDTGNADQQSTSETTPNSASGAQGGGASNDR